VNNNAQFSVGSSDPNATYQWQIDLGFGFQNLSNAGQYSGVTTGTLTVFNVTMSNNNQNFRSIVSSGSCSDTSDVAVLTVNDNASIDEAKQDNLFTVFPNPAQSIITVKADKAIIGAVYSIYDNTGKVVLTGKLIAESTTIELGNLSGGIYMFSVGEKIKQTFKVIKE
ncbi:MAG: T9SS type A sorting domain-containing protein, partial [Bacteroidetes bacterium]|nr:T9SS type A sorting domain-containing protein [Bacteroidota bacterium]